jgi:hypothetical protein
LSPYWSTGNVRQRLGWIRGGAGRCRGPLAGQYGAEYEAYRRAVPAGWPRLHPLDRVIRRQAAVRRRTRVAGRKATRASAAPVVMMAPKTQRCGFEAFSARRVPLTASAVAMLIEAAI